MGQILRLFTAMPKIGCADQLARLLGTVSPDVVRGQPGCLGWAALAPRHGQGPYLFMSHWAGIEAVVERFGADWQEAHLPEGYAELIEWCSLEHFDLLGKQLLDGSTTRTPP